MTLRPFEEELFEDDAPEYVRRDLDSTSQFRDQSGVSFSGASFNADFATVFTDSETRRQAASDFTKALMEQFESQVTAIVTQYVGAYLQVRRDVAEESPAGFTHDIVSSRSNTLPTLQRTGNQKTPLFSCLPQSHLEVRRFSRVSRAQMRL